MNIILIALLKLLDSLIITGQLIATHKNKILLSCSLLFISQILFYLVVSKVIAANNLTYIFAVAFAAAIGSFIAFTINNTFSKDTLFLNIITSSDKTCMHELSLYLIEHKIKHIVTDSYTLDWQPTLSVQIFANTRNQSRIIDDFMVTSDKKYGEFKFLRQIIE